MNKLTAIFFLFFCVVLRGEPTNDNNFLIPFEPVEWSQNLYEKLLELDVRFNTKLFDLDILEPLNKLIGGYGYEVQKRGDQSLRTDRWTTGVRLSPGTLLLDGGLGSLPISVGINAGREVTFIRPFDKEVNALTAAPRTPMHLPFSAERAIKLKTGEFVSFPLQMGLEVGIGQGINLERLQLGGVTGVFWSGEFQFSIFKKENNQVEVKIIPRSTTGARASIGASAKLKLFGYGPFGLVNIDRQLEKQLGLHFFSSHKQANLKTSVGVTYQLDLNNPDAQKAYDALLKDILTLSPLSRSYRIDPSLQGIGIGSMSLLEKLRIEDLKKEKPRVTRKFFASDSSTGIGHHLRIGTKLLDGYHDRNLQFHHPTDLEQSTKYDVPTWTNSEGFTALFSYFYRRDRITVYGVAEDGKYKGLVMKFEHSEKDLNLKEARKYQRFLKSMMGSDVYEKMGNGNFFPHQKLERFRGTMEMHFPPELVGSLKLMGTRNPELFRSVLLQAITEMDNEKKPRKTVVETLLGYFSSAADTVSQLFENIMTLSWDVPKRKAFRQMMEIFADLPSQGEVVFTERILKLLNSSEAAQKFVPTYLTNVSHIIGWPPSITTSFEAKNQDSFSKKWGENQYQLAQSRARNLLRELNHRGYPVPNQK